MAGQGSGDDPKRVEASATFIRELVEAAGRDKLELALKVGEHIFDEFFGGSILSFTDKGRNSPSLRALLEHPQVRGLGLSHSTVSNFVRVAIQDTQFEGLITGGKLPKETTTLGYTKRVRLLVTKRPGDLIRIVKAAVDNDLNVAQIEELVREANASKTGKGRKPDVDEVKAAKRLLEASQTLYLADLGQVKDDDLASAAQFTQAGARVAGWAAAKMAGELTKRGQGSQETRLTDIAAADTPAELGQLLTELVGEDLGLVAAVREDTADAIRQLGDKILADLKWADAEAAQQWFLDFGAAAAAHLGCTDELASRLGLSKKGVQRTSTSRPRGLRTWFLVFAHDPIPDVPFTFDTFVAQTHNPPRVKKCIVQAVSKDDAVGLFRDRAGGFDPDAQDPLRVIAAEPLEETLRGFRVTVKAHLARPRIERSPTIEEFVQEHSRRSRADE